MISTRITKGPMIYYRTLLGNVVTTESKPDRDGYIATTSVLTGRPYGRLRVLALHPATSDDIERALSERLALAMSPPQRHADCEMARARAAARRAIGME